MKAESKKDNCYGGMESSMESDGEWIEGRIISPGYG